MITKLECSTFTMQKGVGYIYDASVLCLDYVFFLCILIIFLAKSYIHKCKVSKMKPSFCPTLSTSYDRKAMKTLKPHAPNQMYCYDFNI